MLDIASVVSILTAVGFGTLLTQWAAGGKDRRAARASALKALADVENSRWAGSVNAGTPDFQTSVRELETAALVARVPRLPLKTYLHLASAARGLSDEGFERYGGEEEGAGIHSEYADVVRDSARFLSDAIWSPNGIIRFSGKRRAKNLINHALAINDNEVRQQIQRAKDWPAL